MSKQDYITRTDGWTAGQWRSKGSIVALTPAQAKYENVALKSDIERKAAPKVEVVGSLDDPTVKSSGLAGKAATEETKRGSAKK